MLHRRLQLRRQIRPLGHATIGLPRADHITTSNIFDHDCSNMHHQASLESSLGTLNMCSGLKEDNNFKITLRSILQICLEGLDSSGWVDYDNKRAFGHKKCLHSYFNQDKPSNRFSKLHEASGTIVDDMYLMHLTAWTTTQMRWGTPSRLHEKPNLEGAPHCLVDKA